MNQKAIIRINIRWIRDTCGLSQSKFAATIKAGRPIVGAWEEGRSIPTIEHLTAISDAFKIALDDLVRVELSTCYRVKEVKSFKKFISQK